MNSTIGLLFALLACGGDPAAAVDADGDGWPVGEDCDDGDLAIHPGAADPCDGEDNDCDASVDEDGASVWYADGDGDGYGGDETESACVAPDGYGANTGDCDDGDAQIHPAAAEICNGIDDDCDGAIDDEQDGGVADGAEGYRDADGDGYGDGDAFGLWCEPSERGDDCDDADPEIPRGDGWYADVDGDGFGDASAPVDPCETDDYVESDDDCDDTNAAIHPDARELCEPDGVDEDCDGVLDGYDEDSACFSYRITSSLWSADASLEGISNADDSGCAVAGVGDVDGDGLDDLLVGAKNNSRGGAGAGVAYLVLGLPSGVTSLGGADATLVGDSAGILEASGDRAGYAVAGAGDVDADGYADLLVSAPENDDGGSGAGAAYLLLGMGPDGPISGTRELADADAVLLGPSRDAQAGYGLAGAGDVDGDGFDDVFVGAGGARDASDDATGAAYLVLGPVSGELDLGGADAALFGESDGASAGHSIAGVGDVNGDGLSDLLIGAHDSDRGGSQTGVAYLVTGPVSSSRSLSDADAALLGAAAGDDAGYAVAGAGDVDGDGFDDLLIGAPEADTSGQDAGAAYLVLARSLTGGELDLADADASFLGEDPEDYAGHAVAGAGDVDGDGLGDVLMGAPSNSAAGDDAGAAYLALGPLTGAIPLSEVDFKLHGAFSNSYAGHSAVAGAGDVDGDGLDDLLIGAYGVTTAYLVLGGSLIP